ncbi:MAG: outer membrane lipoprotein carrier protein LolA [Sphingosinicella sp.]|nr:outer membrane lipoprotein carrier protein LolA [Sphingosinicella sp.]
MKRFAALALVAAPVMLTGLVPAPVTAQAQSPQLAQVQQHLRAVGTMTASFTQTDRRGQTLNGQLFLKRPGKIRFQYGKNVPMLVVANGKSLTMVDYQVKQVQSWPIGNSPLSVLLNPNQDLARFAKVVPNTDPRVVLVEARDPRRPEFGRITMAFAKVASAPAGLMLQGWTMLDSQNNRTTVRLSGQRFNVAIADSQFRYVDPRKK